MAATAAMSLSSLPPKPISQFTFPSPCNGNAVRRILKFRALSVTMASSSDGMEKEEKSTRLVTFLGKGGSGKTTSAVFAAQHYAKAGLKTCLVIHSQDSTAEHLLDCSIGTNPVTCNGNLSAVRLETTKMMLEPLKRVKEADARLNLTQGILEGVVGEELGVLPGMDSIFSLLALEKFVNFSGNKSLQNRQREEYDMIVYDGISCEETLRMIGASSKARLYLRYLRSMSEKTDVGRLVGPSVVRLVDDAMSLMERQSPLDGNTTAKIWDLLEKMLMKGSSAFLERQRFGCFVVMDPNNPASVKSALRYWGCTIQAGAFVSGALGVASPKSSVESSKRVEKMFSPLPFAFIPHFPSSSPPDWGALISNSVGVHAQELLSSSSRDSNIMQPVKFDSSSKSVTLLMPGFDKSEIKLYQYRGGSELLVEAGDQRRVIGLPSDIQGKVAGAKFIERSLIITMR